jgi:hypothetical protein
MIATMEKIRKNEADKIAASEASGTAKLDQLLLQLGDEEHAIEASFKRRNELLKESNKLNAIENKDYADIEQAILDKKNKAIIKAEKEELIGKFDTASNIAGKLSNLAESENSKMIEIQRGASIVQATMSGATAYMGALGSPPYGPAAIIMAGMIAAQTAVQIATIAGARATGGPVSGGKNYLVGERGPEIFSPDTSGNIIPNNAIGGGGITVNIVEDASKAGQVEQNGPDLSVYVSTVMDNLYSEFNSGRGLFAAMEQKYGLAR